jgi:hypothetical protein
MSISYLKKLFYHLIIGCPKRKETPTVQVLRASKIVQEIPTRCITHPLTPVMPESILDKQLANVKDKVQAGVFDPL